MISSKNIHGTALAIEDSGLLILGPSGSGKSDLALRLIDSGATLVADDITICKRENNEIFMFCDDSIKGIIEVRGIGLVKVPYVEGIKLKMVIKLIDQKIERFPLEKEFYKLLSIKKPLIKINPKELSANAKIKLKLFELKNGL